MIKTLLAFRLLKSVHIELTRIRASRLVCSQDLMHTSRLEKAECQILWQHVSRFLINDPTDRIKQNCCILGFDQRVGDQIWTEGGCNWCWNPAGAAEGSRWRL